MQTVEPVIHGVTHQIYATLLGAARRLGSGDVDVAAVDPAERDRGAVSLEQVLWFVAAGVSVAVVAGIIWAKIKDEADNDIVSPAAP